MAIPESDLIDGSEIPNKYAQLDDTWLLAIFNPSGADEGGMTFAELKEYIMAAINTALGVERRNVFVYDPAGGAGYAQWDELIEFASYLSDDSVVKWWVNKTQGYTKITVSDESHLRSSDDDTMTLLTGTQTVRIPGVDGQRNITLIAPVGNAITGITLEVMPRDDDFTTSAHFQTAAGPVRIAASDMPTIPAGQRDSISLAYPDQNYIDLTYTCAGAATLVIGSGDVS